MTEEMEEGTNAQMVMAVIAIIVVCVVIYSVVQARKRVAVVVVNDPQSKEETTKAPIGETIHSDFTPV